MKSDLNFFFFLVVVVGGDLFILFTYSILFTPWCCYCLEEGRKKKGLGNSSSISFRGLFFRMFKIQSRLMWMISNPSHWQTGSNLDRNYWNDGSPFVLGECSPHMILLLSHSFSLFLIFFPILNIVYGIIHVDYTHSTYYAASISFLEPFLRLFSFSLVRKWKPA